MPNTIRTRVVTFYTAKHFIIPIETLFKHLPFLGLSQFKNFKRTELNKVSLCQKLLANVVIGEVMSY